MQQEFHQYKVYENRQVVRALYLRLLICHIYLPSVVYNLPEVLPYFLCIQYGYSSGNAKPEVVFPNSAREKKPNQHCFLTNHQNDHI